MLTTVSTLTPGFSAGLEIFQDGIFRELVRRSNQLVRIEIGQGPDDWASVEMDRGTGVVTYQARPETTLSWDRFVRWVGVQVEFIEVARQG